MKLPASIKGSAKPNPQMLERQREITQEVNARYKHVVGGQVGGKAAQDTSESNVQAHEIVDRHRQRVVALSEEYNKLKLRAEQMEERAKEMHLKVTLEASAGGLRAPMSDQELELILAERKEGHPILLSPTSRAAGAGPRDGLISNVMDAAVFAGNAAVNRSKIFDTSAVTHTGDAEDFSHREILRARLSERDQIFEAEQRVTGTYKLMASRLAKTKKEEAARNADLGEVMASRQAQLERLKAELMLQDKMTKKVKDELRFKQEMLMGRRRAWEERRQDLLDIVEEAASQSKSDELRDAVNLRNKAFANRVSKLGINLEELKPSKPKQVAHGGPRLKQTPSKHLAKTGTSSGGKSNASGGAGWSAGGERKPPRGKNATGGTTSSSVGPTRSKSQQKKRFVRSSKSGAGPDEDTAADSEAGAQVVATTESADETALGVGGEGDGAKPKAKPDAEKNQHVDDDGDAAAVEREGDATGEGGRESPTLIPEGKVGLAKYHREAKKRQTERRLAVQMELLEKDDEDVEEPEEADKRKEDMQNLLKRDAEKRVLAERERIRKERLAEIEAKALKNQPDPSIAAKLNGFGVGEVTDQRSKMEKLFALISRSLGVPESTDAMVVAETIVELADDQRKKKREEADEKRKEADEAREAATASVGDDKIAVEAAAEEAEAAAQEAEAAAVAMTSAGTEAVAALASAQLTSNRDDKEALLKDRKKVLKDCQVEIQARVTAKMNEISGGGLASVKDVVDLEEKIDSTISSTEWMMTRVASSSKVAKNASMGVNQLYALLRRKGRVWRASDVFSSRLSKGDREFQTEDPSNVRSSSRLSVARQGASSPELRSSSRLSMLKDDSWNVDNDPDAEVHPGLPLAAHEGNSAADEGGMIELNVARLDDIAASLVAMVRAARLAGVGKGKFRRSKKSLTRLSVVGEDGGGGEGEGGGGGGESPSSSSVRGGDGSISPGAGGGSRRTSERTVLGSEHGGENEEGGGGGGDGGEYGGIAQKPSSMRGATKKLLALKKATGAQFQGMIMNLALDSESSDDDDVQAGGRARMVVDASDDDSQDYDATPHSGDGGKNAGFFGGGRVLGGRRGTREGRGMQGMMARAKKNANKTSSSSDASGASENQDRAKSKSKSSSVSSANATRKSSLSNMPKISETSPASGRTPVTRGGGGGGSLSKKKSETAATDGGSRGKVTSVTGSDDLYSGKVKKKAGGNPEYPTGFFDDQPHSGSRSFSADRPLPV